MAEIRPQFTDSDPRLLSFEVRIQSDNGGGGQEREIKEVYEVSNIEGYKLIFSNILFGYAISIIECLKYINFSQIVYSTETTHIGSLTDNALLNFQTEEKEKIAKFLDLASTLFRQFLTSELQNEDEENKDQSFREDFIKTSIHLIFSINIPHFYPNEESIVLQTRSLITKRFKLEVEKLYTSS